jgi:hypothetical protein
LFNGFIAAGLLKLAGTGQALREDQVDLDIYAVNTRQMQDFLNKAGSGDWAAVAEVVSIMITDMPSEWGDKNNVDDLLDLVPFLVLKRITQLIIEGVSDTEKN